MSHKNRKSGVILPAGTKLVTTVPGTQMSPSDVQYSDTGLPGSWSPTESPTSTHRRSVFDTKTSDTFIVVTTINGVQFVGLPETGELGFSPNVNKGPDGQWIDEIPYLQ